MTSPDPYGSLAGKGDPSLIHPYPNIVTKSCRNIFPLYMHGAISNTQQTPLGAPDFTNFTPHAPFLCTFSCCPYAHVMKGDVGSAVLWAPHWVLLGCITVPCAIRGVSGAIKLPGHRLQRSLPICLCTYVCTVHLIYVTLLYRNQKCTNVIGQNWARSLGDIIVEC